ncbi:MAG: ABC transporter permease [Bdellovibrionaceae bacterium]|nr:ABC transporter permease [Pseudobdellovibrionaceae bacterium]
MLWDFFWRFLFSKRAGSIVRKISWLSFAALTVSVASLVIVMAVMKALNTNIRNRLLAVEPHLVIEITDNNEYKTAIAQIEERQVLKPEWRVFPFEVQDVILRSVEGRFRGAVARGLTPESLDWILSEIKRAQQNERREEGPVTAPEINPDGTVLGERGALEAGEIMAGLDLAHSLGIFEGDSLTVVAPEGLMLPAGETPKFERVIVKKILSTNLQDFDGEGLFYLQNKTLPSFQSSASLRRGYEIWTEDSAGAIELKEDLIRRLEGLPVKVQTWQDRNAALFLSLKLEKLVIGLFLSIASLVAGFSLLTVLGLLISQKTREIGLLQAIGLSRREVFFLFQGLGVRLTGLGLFCGSFIGLVIATYMELYPLKVLPDIYYDSTVPAEVDLPFVIVIVILGYLLSYFGGLLITRPLAKFQPTELLRMKK